MPRHHSPSSVKTSSVKGFTLIESAIVLGVVGVIVAAIWLLAGSVQESGRQNKAIQQVQELSANLRQSYQRIGTLAITAQTNVTTTLATEVWPQEMVASGTTPVAPVTPWGGAVAVYTAITGGASRFYITFNTLQRDACANLLTKSTGGELPGLYQVNVNSGGTVVTMPSHFTITSANTACSSATANTINWIFNLH